MNMNMLSPGMLLSGVVIGSIGFGLFLYGKKVGNMKCLGAGIAVSVAPYFAPTVAIMWLITGGLIAGLYALTKWI